MAMIRLDTGGGSGRCFWDLDEYVGIFGSGCTDGVYALAGRSPGHGNADARRNAGGCGFDRGFG